MTSAKISLPSFEIQSDETILYQTLEPRPWYAAVWKTFSGLITILIITVIAWFLLSGPVAGLLSNVLPSTATSILTNILFLGLVPLLVAAWIADDVARTFLGKFVLTDKRLWVRGSPYSWTVTETLLDDIDSLTFHRDAVFIRLKSSKKLFVHMLPDGKLLAKVYKDHFGKPH